jgi:hypothetical protein
LEVITELVTNNSECIHGNEIKSNSRKDIILWKPLPLSQRTDSMRNLHILAFACFFFRCLYGCTLQIDSQSAAALPYEDGCDRVTNIVAIVLQRHILSLTLHKDDDLVFFSCKNSEGNESRIWRLEGTKVTGNTDAINEGNTTGVIEIHSKQNEEITRIKISPDHTKIAAITNSSIFTMYRNNFTLLSNQTLRLLP